MSRSHNDIDIQLIMAKKFKELRLRKNLSQEDCAFMLGITRVSICNIEAGEHGITCKLLLKSAKLFGCTPLDILPTTEEFSPYINSLSESMRAKNEKKIKELEEKLSRLKQNQIKLI